MGTVSPNPLTAAWQRFSRLLPSRPGHADVNWYHYFVAVTLVIAATALRLTALPNLGLRLPYLIFFPCVILAALFGGLRTGLLATALSALAASYFWVEPTGCFGIAAGADVVSLLVFLGSASTISFITAAIHKAETRAKKRAPHDAAPAAPEQRGPVAPPGDDQPGPLKLDAIFPVYKVFAVALVILLIVAWHSYHSTTAMLAADRDDAQSYRLIQRLDQLLLALKDAENNENIFLLTGDPKFLEPYYAALDRVAGELASLYWLSADAPEQQRELEHLEEPLNQRLAELEQAIALRRTHGFDDALQETLDNIDRACMAHILSHVNAMQHGKTGQLRDSMEQKTSHGHGLINTVLAGYCLSFVMLIMVFLLLRKEIGRRARAEGRLRAHQEQLEEKIRQRTEELQLANSCLQRENEARQQVKLALQHSNAQLDLLATTAGQLLASNAPQEIVADLCRQVMEFLNCDLFFNFLVDRESGRLHLHAYAGIAAEEARRIEWIDYGETVCGCVARDERRIIVDHVADSADPDTERVRGYGIHAYACLPLIAEGAVLGTLSFGTRHRPQFTVEETALMQAVADQVAIALIRQQHADLLRDSKERLQLVLAASMMGTFEIDILSGETQWNEVEYQLLGLDPAVEEASQETFYRLVHPDDQASLRSQWEEALWGGELDCEFRIIRADGEERWLAAKGRFVYTMQEHGVAPVSRSQVTRFLGVNYDITAQKRTEKELQELSLRLSYHVDNSPLAVIEWGPDMRLIRWSGAAERIFGWKAAEVLGKRLEDFRWIHPEDAPQVAEIATELHNGGPLRRVSASRNFRKDGVVVQCEWYNSAMTDESGTFSSLLSLVLDVTDRERAEEALRESESRLYSLANAMPQLAWIARADGDIFWFNQRWYDYTGTTPEQVAGWGWQAVHDPAVLPEVLRQWRTSLATGEPFAMEFPLRGADGTFRPFLTRSYPLKDQHGAVISWFGTNTDVSDLKQAEERIQTSLREKEVMLKEIHHRVKNNLQIISSLVDLQADTIDNPLLSGLFQDVRDRVRSMALVHEKLYGSANLAQVEFADYTASLLDYLWSSYGSTAADIRLTLDLKPVLLPVGQAVPCGLILNELVVNALKHAFPGHAPGEITVALSRDRDGNACLCIRDNGAGLPADMDWRQSESLGLRLVQMLTRQVDGAMSVTCKAGTEFRLTFPPPGESKKTPTNERS